MPACLPALMPPLYCSCTAGFEACLNSRQDKPAELIAKYLDSILRRGSKAGAAQESSLEDVLDAALALFRYVQVGAGWVGDGYFGSRALSSLLFPQFCSWLLQIASKYKTKLNF